MGPVSRFPRGFLDLFGLKQLGDYMSTVGDTTSPTFDVSELIYKGNAEVYIQTTAPYLLNGAGGLPSGRYPLIAPVGTAENEVIIVTAWALLGQVLGVNANLPDARVVYVSNANAQMYPFGEIDAVSIFGAGGLVGAAAVRSTLQGGQKPLFIPPGHNIEVLANQEGVGVAGGQISYSVQLRFIRLRV